MANDENAGKAILNNEGHLQLLNSETGGTTALVSSGGLSECPCCSGPLLIWMFIDESEAAYGGPNNTDGGDHGGYESEDTEKLRELYSQYPSLSGTTVVMQLPCTWGSVHGSPPGVRRRSVGRPPSLSELKSAFMSDIERFKGNTGKIYFYTLVDNSGSMTTHDVQPGYNDFLTWLNNDFSNEDDRFVQVHSTSSGYPERWILFIQEPMKDYVQHVLKPQGG